METKHLKHIKAIGIILFFFLLGVQTTTAQFGRTVNKTSVKKKTVSSILFTANLMTDYKMNYCTKNYPVVSGEAKKNETKRATIVLDDILADAKITVEKTGGKAAARVGVSRVASQAPKSKDWKTFPKTSALSSRNLNTHGPRAYVTIENQAKLNKFQYKIKAKKSFSHLLPNEKIKITSIRRGSTRTLYTLEPSCSGFTRLEFYLDDRHNVSELENLTLTAYEKRGASWTRLKSIKLSKAKFSRNSELALVLVNSTRKLKIEIENDGMRTLFHRIQALSVERK